MMVKLIKKERRKSAFGGMWYYLVELPNGKQAWTHYYPTNLTLNQIEKLSK